MTRRQLTLAQLACLALCAASLVALSVHERSAVGPLRHRIACEWSAETNDYQTVLIYTDQQGRPAGRSQPSGRCQPQ